MEHGSSNQILLSNFIILTYVGSPHTIPQSSQASLVLGLQSSILHKTQWHRTSYHDQQIHPSRRICRNTPVLPSILHPIQYQLAIENNLFPDFDILHQPHIHQHPEKVHPRQSQGCSLGTTHYPSYPLGTKGRNGTSHPLFDISPVSKNL